MPERLAMESRLVTDPDTGRALRQVTDAPCVNHHPFFLCPARDPSGRYLYFVSWRTGVPQLYAEDSREGCILRLTDEPGLDEWSVHPAGDGVYFLAHGDAMVARPDGTVETLLSAREVLARFGGALGEGVTALTRDGSRWAVRLRREEGFGILVWERSSNAWSLVYTGPMVAQLQFCPDDNDLLFLAGPLTDRVWTLDLRTRTPRRLYARNAAARQWITHESWLPGRRELCLVDWPHGLLAVHADTGEVRRVADFNAWHAIANDQGTMMAADTNFPDTGLWLLDPREEHAQPRLLCCPHASCMGEHWAHPFPYDHGPIRVNAPQHTHPHPRFAPDGRSVIFTSDRTGHAQVYEIPLEGDAP